MKILACALILIAFTGCLAPKPQPDVLSAVQQRQVDEANRQVADAEAERNSKRSAYLTAHPDLTPEIRNAIANHGVIIGMTEEQVWASLQGWRNFHSLITENVRSDECTYQDLHLYFVNGVLSTIVQ